MMLRTLLSLLLWCAAVLPAQAQDTLTVAVASSLYPLLQPQPGVRLVAGSSGHLYRQIGKGAPFDVFISADARYPSRLRAEGRAVAEPEVLGTGYLGIVIGRRTVRDPQRLRDPEIRHIVIANPDVAPFGVVARRALQQRGLWQAVEPRLVYARNAMQAKMMVQQGLVDAGLVPVRKGDMALAAIEYVAVLLHDNEAARAWLKRLRLP